MKWERAAAPREARLQVLLAGMGVRDAGCDAVITGLSSDSRALSPGALFLAAPGGNDDGRRYIGAALKAGAAAVAYEEQDAPQVSGGAVPVVAVDGLSRRIGLIAERFYDHPSRALRVAVVTGTNGKTTCVHLGARALTALGRPCGLVGTLGAGMPEALHECGLTTPDPLRLRRELAAILAAGAEAVMIEGSSHGLAQHRLDDLRVHTALFTNLGRDHLDYHGDAAAYGAAKARLFSFPGLEYAIVNLADPFGARILERCKARHVLGYGSDDAQVRALAVRSTISGLALRVATPWGELDCSSRLIGRANVHNLLAVVALLGAMGCDAGAIARVMPLLQPAPGRMECFGGGARPLVVVDYAHTPDALDNALRSLREHAAGALWCVFGCGGDRDRGKRPLMGAIAERHADHVILSDDNPRHEPSAAIIEDIVGGMSRRPVIEPERRAAIAAAVAAAAPGDAVLVAGKGHETTQTVGARVLPLSDRDIVRACLDMRNADPEPEQ